MPLGGLYVYAPEIYPTRMRAMGAGSASAWLRLGAICGPIAVGAILPVFGLRSAFLFFGVAAVMGALVMFMLGLETSVKMLWVRRRTKRPRSRGCGINWTGPAWSATS